MRAKGRLVRIAVAVVGGAMLAPAGGAKASGDNEWRLCSGSPGTGDWEVVLGHFRSRNAAVQRVVEAKKKGLRATIEEERCVEFEVAVIHIRTRRAAVHLRRHARQLGFHATIEQS